MCRVGYHLLARAAQGSTQGGVIAGGWSDVWLHAPPATGQQLPGSCAAVAWRCLGDRERMASETCMLAAAAERAAEQPQNNRSIV
jgi:hypothetical protein